MPYVRANRTIVEYVGKSKSGCLSDRSLYLSIFKFQTQILFTWINPLNYFSNIVSIPIGKFIATPGAVHKITTYNVYFKGTPLKALQITYLLAFILDSFVLIVPWDDGTLY